MISTLETMAKEIIDRAATARRFVVAIAGPPGAGKSTLAERLAETIGLRGDAVEVLPMDGFHMDNAVLEQKGLLARKGAPETFDVRAFIDIMKAVRSSDGEVLVPVFDRSREIAIAAARVVSPDTRIVLVEGNYLLLDETPWTALEGMFDYSILIAPPAEVLETRLWHRWESYDYAHAAAHAKIYGNDLPNGQRVLDHRRRADVTIAGF